MKTIFKKGDRVYDVRYGWGTVFNIDDWKGNLYPVIVAFDGATHNTSYEQDGIPYGMNMPMLSFTEYTLQGFSQERPKKEPEIGSLCLFSDDKDLLKNNSGYVGILERIDREMYSPFKRENGSCFVFCKQIEIKEV